MGDTGAVGVDLLVVATTGGGVVERGAEANWRRGVGTLKSAVVRPAEPDDANRWPSRLSASLAACALETAAAANPAPVAPGAAPAEPDDAAICEGIDAGLGRAACAEPPRAANAIPPVAAATTASAAAATRSSRLVRMVRPRCPSR